MDQRIRDQLVEQLRKFASVRGKEKTWVTLLEGQRLFEIFIRLQRGESHKLSPGMWWIHGRYVQTLHSTAPPKASANSSEESAIFLSHLPNKKIASLIIIDLPIQIATVLLNLWRTSQPTSNNVSRI